MSTPEKATRKGNVAVALRSISMSYPGVQALKDVDIEIERGMVHAVCGENGAGKSTLSKVVAGLIRPDSGTITVNGEQVVLESPAAARRLGISAVPQELSLVPHLTVAENICMNAFPNRAGMVSRGRLRQEARAVLESLGLDIDPMSRLGGHGPGVQQLVMIGRGFTHDADVIILDEPTAALTEPEVDHLFEVVQRATASGTAFIYVSHRLQELGRIADTVTVMRDGQRMLTCPMGDIDHDGIVKAMVGRLIERFTSERSSHQPTRSVGGTAPQQAPTLCVRDLTGTDFRDISFEVNAGEIVGIAGLMGSGRTELARAIFGVDSFASGAVEVDGERKRITSPRKAINAGIAMVPEERKSQGLVLGRSVEDNLTVAQLRGLSTSGWLRRRRAREAAKQAVARLGVRPARTDVAVRTLSGGNQQKVVIGRWFFRDFKVYLFDEPTRGVDINAKFEIYRVLHDIADSGAGMVVISSELPELLAICDRILVMREGQLVDEFQTDVATEETILAAAMGSGAA